MCDAPELLWLWPAEPEDGVDKFVSFPGQRYPSGSTTYIRADVARATDALLREAVDALICVIPTHRFVGNFCWCHAARDTDAGHTAECLKARATLAKLREHLGDSHAK